jgi:FkbM family methyltransferase
MRITEAMIRLTYSGRIRRGVRKLGLGRSMQLLYSRVRARAGVVKLSLNSVEAWFSARTPIELRCTEAGFFCERETLSRIQERLKPGDVFLDVGSNLGIFTVFGARVVGPQGTVISCEPGTEAFNQLQTNIELNELTNVRPLKLALGDRHSTMRLALGNAESLCGMAHLSDEDGPAEEVQTVSYDSLVAQQGLPIPRVVKIDIEGHEYAALKGMERTLSDPACVAIFCEIHPYALPRGVSLQDVTSFIESLGFELVSSRWRSSSHSRPQYSQFRSLSHICIWLWVFQSALFRGDAPL